MAKMTKTNTNKNKTTYDAELQRLREEIADAIDKQYRAERKLVRKLESQKSADAKKWAGKLSKLGRRIDGLNDAVSELNERHRRPSKFAAMVASERSVRALSTMQVDLMSAGLTPDEYNTASDIIGELKQYIANIPSCK